VAVASAQTGGSVIADCGIRGGSSGPRGCASTGADKTTIKVYSQACAESQKMKPAAVVQNCTGAGQFLGESSSPDADQPNAKYTRYTVHNVLLDTKLFVVAVNSALQDKLGNSVMSNHPSIDPLTLDILSRKANLIMTNSQGMTTSVITGSELMVGEPTDVLYTGPDVVYPFTFESAENWQVNVCLALPEGYEVVDGQSCDQILVAGQPTLVEFKVKEVGSTPGNATVTLTMTSPEGKVTTREDSIGVRIDPALAAKKGVSVNSQGYLAADVPTAQAPATTPSTTGEPTTPKATTPAAPITPGVSSVSEPAPAAEKSSMQVILIVLLVIVVIAIILMVWKAARSGKPSQLS
jgi:hypothetical protein